MDQRERIAALFDRVADTYDGVGVDLVQPIAARLVLAWGSGTGFCAEHSAIAAMVTAGEYQIAKIVAV